LVGAEKICLPAEKKPVARFTKAQTLLRFLFSPARAVNQARIRVHHPAHSWLGGQLAEADEEQHDT